MQLKYLIIIILFYFFALLQNTFFLHFSLLGAVPNLVFILFFLTVFFSPKKISYIFFLYAVFAGLLADNFLYTHFGLSVILFIIIGYFAKKMQTALKEKEDKYPFVYFILLFLIWLLIYDLLAMFYLRFIDSSRILPNFGAGFWAGLVYNSFVAFIGFYIFKKARPIHGKDL
jgi:rod shape-determining protein MreD